MPTLMPSDTKAIFAANAEKFDSRSLLLDRFVYDHPRMDDARRLHFARVCEDSFKTIQATRAQWQDKLREERDAGKRRELQEFLDDSSAMARRSTVVGPAERDKAASSRRAFLASLHGAEVFHAQLQARLMVNMAGGVMENAGLLLDRFGLPYLPGTAVKGCARRAALAALREWCETGHKPGETAADQGNLFAAACRPFATPAEMLAAIARVFGWCEQDWSDRPGQSDFAWACASAADDAPAPTGRAIPAQGHALGSGPAANLSPEGAAQAWPAIRDKAIRQLASELRVPIPEDAPQPAKHLPNFAGTVAFLPAYPVDLGKTGPVNGLPVPVPELGKLELDVVTCHHRDYYGGKLPVATDTEEPNPVVFPAVAPGHVFTFALVPLRQGSTGNLPVPSGNLPDGTPAMFDACAHARTWLQTGLETFGLGAKTNAGYGWFQVVARNSDGSFGSTRSQTPPPGLGTAGPPATQPKPAPQLPAGDYNDVIFRNSVLDRLDRPQDYALLQKELATLQKPANAAWLDKLKRHLASADAKEARKRLKQKDWFPKDWLPA